MKKNNLFVVTLLAAGLLLSGCSKTNSNGGGGGCGETCTAGVKKPAEMASSSGNPHQIPSLSFDFAFEGPAERLETK